jgi:hypothetical protein
MDMKKKPAFILRRTENRHALLPRGFIEEFTWDIMLKTEDGEEFVAEFVDGFEKLARKAVRALNDIETTVIPVPKGRLSKKTRARIEKGLKKFFGNGKWRLDEVR